MEKITFEDTAKELVNQLESVLGKLALAADSGLPTYSIEDKATKLASKLKTIASVFNGLDCIYKDVEGETVYYALDLPDNIFSRFAALSKKCKDASMSLQKSDNSYYAEIGKNIFVKLDDLPSATMPKFKVKIEGDTLMAVNEDLYAKLPEKMQKLLGGVSNGE